MIVLYSGAPVQVRWWSTAGDLDAAVDGVVEVAETPAGSLVLRTVDERVMCPAGTWGRLAWPYVDGGVGETYLGDSPDRRY
jgi:hypothetical protein